VPDDVEILLISGSLRYGSTNSALIRTAADVSPASIAAVVYEGLADLPHFNPDDDEEGQPLDPAVTALRSALAAADATLFCTPEYAGALPGSFKNLLDWTVGGGQTYGMPVGWVNVAFPPRGENAHESLRKVLGYTGSAIIEDAAVRTPVGRDLVDESGMIADAEVRAAVSAVLEALAESARRQAEDDLAA
jgi:NAD(P)H-dependent FMN reductase